MVCYCVLQGGAVPKKRDKSPEEFFRGLLREANKRIRQLEQEVKSLRKYERSQDEEVVVDEEDTYPDKKPLIRCDSCSKGFYEEFEIMDKVIGTCNVCGDRKRLK